MDILENEIEDVIYKMFEDRNDLCHSIVDHPGMIFRQVNVPGYGRVDLINVSIAQTSSIPGGYKRDWEINVIELKRGKIGYNELGQTARYVTAVKNFCKKIKPKHDSICVKGCLIGRAIEDKGDFVFLLNCIEDISVFTMKLNYDTGLSFNQENCDKWKVTGEKFNHLFDYIDRESFYQYLKDETSLYSYFAAQERLTRKGVI